MDKIFFIVMALAIGFVATRLDWSEIQHSAIEFSESFSSGEQTHEKVQGSEPVIDPQTIKVFVSMGGRTYHSSDCQLLRNGKMSTTLAIARGKGFTPCNMCRSSVPGMKPPRPAHDNEVDQAALLYRENVLRKQGRLPSTAKVASQRNVNGPEGIPEDPGAVPPGAPLAGDGPPPP